MNVDLVDGTYELFRCHFGAPGARAPDGREVGATRGLLRTLYALVTRDGATHLGVAFDHVVESFRNRLFPGYKTGAGVPDDLMAQFGLAERAAAALGLLVWPMIDFEADDALATAAAWATAQPEVERVRLASPDKDLAQCVVGTRVVVVSRFADDLLDHGGVMAKFGVAPASIPDWLALVGDTADGIPGIPRWGKKAASTLLARYHRLEDIPDDPATWEVKVRGAVALGESLRTHREEARLYRTLATLRTDVPLGLRAIDDLRWRGARRGELEALCEEIGDQRFATRVTRFDDGAPAGT